MGTEIRISELVRRLREAGPRETAARVVRRLSRRFDQDALDFPLLPGDVSDSTRIRIAPLHRAARDPLTPVIGIVCTPPSAGSGGHTTLFRMVEGLEARGYQCVLFLYDRHGGDHERHEGVVREQWPQMQAEIRSAVRGINDIDACIASSWETAHVIAARVEPTIPRLYFVQDFEPYFYPRGSLSALAEDSYRFGFTMIALGDMVASELAGIGVDSTTAQFGCDTQTYTLTNRAARSGVVFYAKPGADRRGFILAKLALEEFHARHPEQPIHVYGGRITDWAVPTVEHGRLSPEQLNELYNQSIAGLAMSFTNISLVAEELIAAGTVPIVNDSPLARADLRNEWVEWAEPTPGGIADALCRAVEAPRHAERAILAAQSVRDGWGPAQAVVSELVAVALEAGRVHHGLHAIDEGELEPDDTKRAGS